MIKAVATSKVECFLINMVERMMEMARIREPIRIPLCSFKDSLFERAM